MESWEADESESDMGWKIGEIVFEEVAWLSFKSESISSNFSMVLTDFGFKPRDFLLSGREIKGSSVAQ
jgi:hypothetical protein